MREDIWAKWGGWGQGETLSGTWLGTYRTEQHISEESDPELEILGSRSSLVFEQETLCALKNTSLRIQDLISSARAMHLQPQQSSPGC